VEAGSGEHDPPWPARSRALRAVAGARRRTAKANDLEQRSRAGQGRNEEAPIERLKIVALRIVRGAEVAVVIEVFGPVDLDAKALHDAQEQVGQEIVGATGPGDVEVRGFAKVVGQRGKRKASSVRPVDVDLVRLRCRTTSTPAFTSARTSRRMVRLTLLETRKAAAAEARQNPVGSPPTADRNAA